MTNTFYEKAGPKSLLFKILGGLLVIVFVILAIGGLASARQKKTNSTEWGCLYGGGMFDTKGFKEAVAPSSSAGWRWADKMYTLPSDVRSYTIDSDEHRRDPGAVAIELPVRARDVEVGGEVIESEGVTFILVELQVRFTFNENACEWYQKYGRNAEPLNFNAPEGTQTNWTDFLLNSMYKAIREAARPIVSRYDWLQLATNDTVAADENEATIYDILSDGISESLVNELTERLGGNYFCGPGYEFDGDIDGEVGNCPAMEVAIDSLTPKNTTLMENYEAIVANAENQQKIASDRDFQIAQAEAASDVAQAQSRETSQAAIAEAESQAATQTAQAQNEAQVQIDTAEANEQAGVAQANAEEAIANEQLQVAQVEQQIAESEAAADGAFCAYLASVGVNCADYQAALALQTAAENGQYPQLGGTDPQIILSSTDIPLVANVPAAPAE